MVVSIRLNWGGVKAAIPIGREGREKVQKGAWRMVAWPPKTVTIWENAKNSNGFSARWDGLDGAGAAARAGHFRDQLGGRGRTWRLLPGTRGRHLQEVRARSDHRAGWAEREQSHPAFGGQTRLLHERKFAAII